MRKIYIIVAALVGIAIALILAQFSLTSEERHDKQTETDLIAIRDAISSVYEEQEIIQQDISQLNLNDSLLKRANERKYEVRTLSNAGMAGDSIIDLELCAEFKTDTTERYSYRTVKKHKAGFDCARESIYTTIY